MNRERIREYDALGGFLNTVWALSEELIITDTLDAVNANLLELSDSVTVGEDFGKRDIFPIDFPITWESPSRYSGTYKYGECVYDFGEYE